MLDEAKAASGVQSLAVFAALCIVYSDEARREIGYRLNGPKREPVPEPVKPAERNVRPAVAAERLGISVRKLTRGRFTTYREICIPLDGQSRGYVVSERALETMLVRQRQMR